MVLKVILGVVIATLVGLVVMQFIDPNLSNSIFGTQEKEDGNKTNINDDTTGNYSITGSVINPGTYILTLEGSTMEDLINAAGGTNGSADERCYYLETSIVENESYYIPTKYDATNVCGDEEIVKVNINSDDSDAMQTISGIGSVLGNAIVEYRESNGIFYTIEGLMNVPGIGNSKFTQIKDYVILHE